MEKVEGLVDLKVEMQQKIPQINVKVNLATAHQYGIKPGDVRRATSTLVAGEEVGDIHIANRTYDINVWSTPEIAQQPDQHSEPADRHAERQDGAAGRRCRCCRSSRRRTSSSMRT